LGFSVIEKPENCLYCGSTSVIRRGHRRNQNRKLQRFYCNDCKKWFVLNDGFSKMQNDPKVITVALDAYFRGMSLRDVRDHLRQFYGVKVHYVTILRWVGKYTKVIGNYVDSIAPTIGDTWHVDEMAIDVKGKKEWLWNVMDDDTRFLLASKISKRRDVVDARKPLAEAKQRAKIRPRFVVTDGLQSYRDAINKEFYTMANPRTKHVRLPSIREHPNNNIVERLHGTIRERNKVQRGLKEGASTNIAEGHRIFYNFLRGHLGLGEKTPAQKAGIEVPNEWLELIKKATTNS
jgi:transposase-like protein